MDRDFLRARERVNLSQTSELLPSISVESCSGNEDVDDFESNGVSSDSSVGQQGFLASTPVRGVIDPFVVGSPVMAATGDESFAESDSSSDFEYLTGVRNRPKRVVYSDDPSYSHIRLDLPVRWKDRAIKCVKYVDDCLSLEKVCFSNGLKLQINGVEMSVVKAVKSEHHFCTVESNARDRGMIINNGKTKMLCISAARSYQSEPYLVSSDGTRIDCVQAAKILGFHFDTNPNVAAHMAVTQKKFKSRLWALRHLKHNGLTSNELVRVYQSMIRPIAEYCSVVFHSLITLKDSLELERIQAQALKTIYNWKASYGDLLEKSGLERLDTRRQIAFDKFAEKISQDKRFAAWFPLRAARHNEPRLGSEKYKLARASCTRYLRSPLNMMRRRLNELNAAPIDTPNE